METQSKHKVRKLIYKLLIFITLVSCDSTLNNFRSSSEGEKDADDSDKEMEDPQNITGSYLTSSCGLATSFIPRFENDEDYFVYGCQIHNEKNLKYKGKVSEVGAEFSLNSGSKHKAAAIIITQVDEPWNMLIAFDKKITQDENPEENIARLDLKYTAAQRLFNESHTVLNFIPSLASYTSDIVGYEPPVVAAEELIMFVSSKRYKGNLGGISGAHQICQSLADKVNLDGNFRAFLSYDDENKPYHIKDEIKKLGKVRDVRGQLIAHRVEDLFSGQALLRAVNVTERNRKITWLSNAWTGSTSGGQASGDDCKKWTATKDVSGDDFFATAGKILEILLSWLQLAFDLEIAARSCSEEYRIYCISQ